MAAKRAVRALTVSGDLWPTVDGWALRQGYGYRMVGASEGHRLYKKKGVAGLRVLDLHKTNGHVHMEAWVEDTLLQRLLTLFILPSEITIESGGVLAVAPRKFGRREVNDLLGALGQPPID